MRTLFTLAAISSFTMLSAQQYYQNNRGNYQTQSNYNQQSTPKNDPYNVSQQYSDSSNTQGRTGYISDQEIRNKIHEALSGGWFSRGYENVSFEVYNGNVTLNGMIDTNENKNKIAEKVKSIDGVQSVNNQITIKDKPTSDASSNKNKAATYENPASDVYSETQLQKSEKKFPKDVATTKQDRQINAKIHDNLNGWIVKENETLVFKTNNGVVTVYGIVEKTEDAQKLLDKLNDIDGVTAVNSKLNVKK